MITSDAIGTTAAYQPLPVQRDGLFIVLEGISGSGKSTLAALQPYINANARPRAQLTFYLAGVLHASDLASDSLQHGHVIAGRYLNSVIANHAAVHSLDNETVAAVIAPFTSYLTLPDVTIYLHTSPSELTQRIRAKADQTRSDHDLLDDPALLQRLQDRYDQIAATDPTARHLSTTGRSPAELADLITAMLPDRAP